MFIKFFKFDIKNNMFKNKFLFAFIFVYFLILAILHYVHNLNLGDEVPNHSTTDYILNFTSGIEIFYWEQGFRFEIPVLWILTILICGYLNIGYFKDELANTGKVRLILSGKRELFWYSKCMTTALNVIIFYFIGYSISFFVGCLANADVSYMATSFTQFYFDFSSNTIKDGDFNYFTHYFLVPVVMIAICLFQQLLTIIIGNLWSYVCLIVSCMITAYFNSPFLLTSYMMPARSAEFIAEGYNDYVGYIFAFTLSIMSIILGKCIFSRKDIF